MQTLHAPPHTAKPEYEAPTGKLVRASALCVAIGFSLLAGAVSLAAPDPGAHGPLWYVWTFVMLASVLVYGVGSIMFRRSTLSQSRRMQRWLESGSS